MSDRELLPCPFCGEAEWIKRTHITSGCAPERYETGCWNCHAAISAGTQQIADAFWNRRTPKASIPEGYAVVPIEPTPAMLSAAWGYFDDGVWHQMIAAATASDDESPEWTEEEFKKAEPAPSFLARVFGKGGKS